MSHSAARFAKSQGLTAASVKSAGPAQVPAWLSGHSYLTTSARVVRSLDEILLLPRDRSVNGFARGVPIKLVVTGLPLHAQLQAQQSLNRLQSRCGCVAGSVATLTSLVVSAANIAHQGQSPSLVEALGQAFVAIVLSVLIGLLAKMATLAFTQWQFGLRCRAQHRVLTRLVVGANP